MKWLTKNWYIPLIAVLGVALGGVGAVLSYNQQKSAVEPVEQAQTKNEQTVTYEKPTREELLRLVNEERAKNGVAALIIDERLNQSAQRKADDMATYHYFGHMNPQTGKHGYEYAHEAAPDICVTHVSENIGARYLEADTNSKFVTMWIESKPHHYAMIDKGYVYTGFGISVMPDRYIYIVEHFCQP